MFIDFLKKGKIVIGAYCVSLLNLSNNELTGKRFQLENLKITFHNDNILAHSFTVVASKFLILGTNFFRTPPNILSRFDSARQILVPQYEDISEVKLFYLNEMLPETNPYFTELDEFYYLDEIKKLEQRWTKCKDLKEG